MTPDEIAAWSPAQAICQMSSALNWWDALAHNIAIAGAVSYSRRTLASSLHHAYDYNLTDLHIPPSYGNPRDQYRVTGESGLDMFVAMWNRIRSSHHRGAMKALRIANCEETVND